jgi:hypothetical protein
MEEDFWVSQINIQHGLSIDHIVQFTSLWKILQLTILLPNTPDTIYWKLTNDGCYSSKLAYAMQFWGHTTSWMTSLVWRPWASPKCKTFAWLVIQNRVWTADRLQKRGWLNCAICKLCNQFQESTSHLLFKCMFTLRVWIHIKNWLSLNDVDPTSWHGMRNIKEWWSEAIHKQGQSRKAMAALAMLISWEVWKERNARVFRNDASTTMMVIEIKEEALLWSYAGAKALGNVMPRE